MEPNNHLLESLLKNFRLKPWVEEGEHEAYWSSWMEEHPEDLEILEDARAMIRGLPVHVDEIPGQEIDQSFDELSRKLAPSRKVKTLYSAGIYRYAAAIILILIGIFLWNRYDSHQAEIMILTEHTLPGELKQIDLPDSTKVVLNGNSVLEYFDAKDERRVELQGEAHFQVRKIQEESGPKRFVVRTPDPDVAVLGTTFSVSVDSIWTTIVLEEGKVALRNVVAHTGQTELIMKPGEKVIYNSAEGSFSRQEIDAVGYNSWTAHKLSLRNRSVEELIRWFSTTHAIPLRVPEGYSERELTGSVNMENTDTAIKMISMALGLEPVKLNETTWDLK